MRSQYSIRWLQQVAALKAFHSILLTTYPHKAYWRHELETILTLRVLTRRALSHPSTSDLMLIGFAFEFTFQM